ncbi:MAG: cupredoxin domain-containing protein [Candidatus Roizmanbacteria bacterium]|nr:cupredoxin domain-containing protein [Candidatus Roizmanbacteria bacterium]MCR4313579.1 cupredoxin domain-containing protein [Candidatus Roizmanbacteria bacterium]
MNKITGLIIIGFLVVGGIFIFNQKKPVMKQELTTETTTTAMNSVKEFTVTAKSWAFNPEVITVKQGDKVKLKIKSIDVTHGFALPDFDVKIDLVPNKEETVEFTADKKGEFTFFCSVMCGEGHTGMKGKLVVE